MYLRRTGDESEKRKRGRSNNQCNIVPNVWLEHFDTKGSISLASKHAVTHNYNRFVYRIKPTNQSLGKRFGDAKSFHNVNAVFNVAQAKWQLKDIFRLFVFPGAQPVKEAKLRSFLLANKIKSALNESQITIMY